MTKGACARRILQEGYKRNLGGSVLSHCEREIVLSVKSFQVTRGSRRQFELNRVQTINRVQTNSVNSIRRRQERSNSKERRANLVEIPSRQMTAAMMMLLPLTISY